MISRTTFCSAQAAVMRPARTGPMGWFFMMAVDSGHEAQPISASALISAARRRYAENLSMTARHPHFTSDRAGQQRSEQPTRRYHCHANSRSIWGPCPIADVCKDSAASAFLRWQVSGRLRNVCLLPAPGGTIISVALTQTGRACL